MSVPAGAGVVEGVVLVPRRELVEVLVLALVPSSTVVVDVAGIMAPTFILSRILVKITAGDISLSWIAWVSIGVSNA